MKYSLKNACFYIIIILIIAMTSSCSRFYKSQSTCEKSDDLQHSNDSSISISLPINALLRKGGRLHLILKIPEDFQPSQPLLSYFNEYVPKDETTSNWTRIITTRIILCERLSSEKMITQLKDGILRGGTNVKVIEKSHKKYTTYEMSTLIMAYNHKGRREVIFARYYSGPLDCSGFQKTVVVSENLSETQILKKLKNFADNNTYLIKF